MKIIVIIIVILIYLCTYSLCYAAKCGDIEIERLNKLEDKEKKEKDSYQKKK